MLNHFDVLNESFVIAIFVQFEVSRISLRPFPAFLSLFVCFGLSNQQSKKNLNAHAWIQCLEKDSQLYHYPLAGK